MYVIGLDVALKPGCPNVLHDQERQRTSEKGCAALKFPAAVTVSPEASAFGPHDGLEVPLQPLQVPVGPFRGHGLVRTADHEPDGDRSGPCPGIE